jgi:hypothetical protein
MILTSENPGATGQMDYLKRRLSDILLAVDAHVQ